MIVIFIVLSRAISMSQRIFLSIELNQKRKLWFLIGQADLTVRSNDKLLIRSIKIAWKLEI